MHYHATAYCMFNNAHGHGSYFLQVVYTVQSTLDNTMILLWYAFNKAHGNIMYFFVQLSGISNKNNLCYMSFFINYSNTIVYSVY